jgi:alpha-galactosidase
VSTLLKVVVTFAFAWIFASPTLAQEGKLLAPTPPMGWNSWDSYGTTVGEDQAKSNARWMAENLKPFGWQYVVVDMEWFVIDPTPAGNSKTSHKTLDEFGRYTPALNRFPSAANGAGFKHLAEYVHAQGLKFGFHILQGIPKDAVEKNLPIAGSNFHALDAANTAKTCRFNPDNYDLQPNEAGQAYYDSIAKLYAGWGADFIKVDCISGDPYKGDEIRMLSNALQKTGRRIVLSLSDGPSPLEKGDEMSTYSQQWRISMDVWDIWHNDTRYPKGLSDQFARAAMWSKFSKPGHWPDADMLPLGYLGPAPGWGKARESRLSHDEQMTLFSLWCIFRSPLMMGGDLPPTDEWTKSILTNREVLAVDQTASASHQVSATDGQIIWLADAPRKGEKFLAVFNTTEKAKMVSLSGPDLGLADTGYAARDLWSHQDKPVGKTVAATIPPHGCILYKLVAR